MTRKRVHLLSNHDQLATFRYDLKHVTSLTSMPNIVLNLAKFYSA